MVGESATGHGGKHVIAQCEVCRVRPQVGDIRRGVLLERHAIAIQIGVLQRGETIHLPVINSRQSVESLVANIVPVEWRRVQEGYLSAGCTYPGGGSVSPGGTAEDIVKSEVLQQHDYDN